MAAQEEDAIKRYERYQAQLNLLRNPKPGINSILWGAYFWRVLHFISVEQQSSSSSDVFLPFPTVSDLDMFLDLLMLNLVCSMCRNSFSIFRAIFSQEPLWRFSTRLAPFLFFFCAHEWVNLKKQQHSQASPKPSQASPQSSQASPKPSQVWFQYQLKSDTAIINRQSILSDFFTVVAFILEHTPDLNFVQPNVAFTRSKNKQFVVALSRVFAGRYFAGPHQPPENKPKFLRDMETRFNWEAENSTQLLETLHQIEVKWLEDQAIPTEKRLQFIQSKVLSHTH